MAINILIVDDSRLIRQVVKKVIKQTGILADECYEACDGLEALSIIKSKPVDLILTDINMPNMDGLEMLMQLRQMEDKQDLPVIVVTTEGSQETMDQAMELGATSYIFKPFTPEVLAEQLRNAGFAMNSSSTSGFETNPGDPSAF